MKHSMKKITASCLAVACAASITFSGASFVWAADEIDETMLSTIVTYAEGLTETIVELSDEEIESYLETDDDFTVSAMTAWQDSKDELGELAELGETEVEFDDDQYTATVPATFEGEDAEFVYIFDENLTPTSLSVDIQYSLAHSMKNAALNTLMGLGTVFVVLALLIFLISLFKYIPGSGAQKVVKKTEPAPAPAPAAPAPAPVQTAPAVDNGELVAVIAAAIAAAEGTSTDSFIVRSIRKVKRSRR